MKDAVPDVVEEMKWKKPSNPDGVHTWSYQGLIGHGQVFKGKVKVTFAYGAKLDDPKGLFNASLGATRCARSTSYEGDGLDKTEFKQMVRRAATLNES